MEINIANGMITAQFRDILKNSWEMNELDGPILAAKSGTPDSNLMKVTLMMVRGLGIRVLPAVRFTYDRRLFTTQVN